MNDLLIRDFGKAVRFLRRNKDMSQETLAALCGLDRTYIGGVERGERNPTLLVIGKIATGLSVSLAELFDLVISDEITR